MYPAGRNHTESDFKASLSPLPPLRRKCGAARYYSYCAINLELGVVGGAPLSADRVRDPCSGITSFFWCGWVVCLEGISAHSHPL